MMVPMCEGQRGRNRALFARHPQVSGGAAARRSICCSRPERPAAPARSGTRTSESRGAPGSATRLRRRSLRMKALAKIMCASGLRLTVASKCAVGPYAVAMAAPLDAAAEKARYKYNKGQDVANGSEPAQVPERTQPKEAMELGLQREAAGQRQYQNQCRGGQSAEAEAEQGQRHGIGHRNAGEAERIDRADGARPA